MAEQPRRSKVVETPRLMSLSSSYLIKRFVMRPLSLEEVKEGVEHQWQLSRPCFILFNHLKTRHGVDEK